MVKPLWPDASLLCAGCLFSDPPEHTWYRKLIQQSFAPRHIASMETEITTLVKELIDVMEEDETRDLHDALACPLPVLVIAKILGSLQKI